MKCIRCKNKSTSSIVVGGRQVQVCTKCLGDWLDKKDEAVDHAFVLFFPTAEPNKKKKKKAKTTESSPELTKALKTLLKEGK